MGGYLSYQGTLTNLNLLACLHFCMISECLFSTDAGSACRISSFSVRQRSQRRVPHRYGDGFFRISQLRLYAISLLFRSDMYLDKLVEELRCSRLNEDMCVLYRSLKVVSVEPM